MPADLSQVGATGTAVCIGAPATLHDTNQLTSACRGFIIAGPGPNANGYCDVSIIDYNGNNRTIAGLACGIQHWIVAKGFRVTGTTAAAVITPFFSFFPLPLFLVLAQYVPTTMPSPDMGQWSPAAVVFVATVIAGLIAGTIIPSLIAYQKSKKAEDKSDKALEKSSEAKGKADAQQTSITNLAEQNRQQQGTLDAVQRAVPPENFKQGDGK